VDISAKAKRALTRGSAVQSWGWSDLCFNVHDLRLLTPRDVERLRGQIIDGCDVILHRG
jgi:hypothetical protein